MDITFHYPPELFQLLIETIPRLCKYKRDVFLFFRGAGVENSVFSDIREQWARNHDSINKFEIARTVLTRLNEAGESALRERREILKRVVEFEDFTTCWPNDRVEAQGLVSSVQKVVNVKDTFTRINQEREAEVRKRRESERNKAEQLRQQQETLKNIRQDFNRLFTIDGVIELDGDIYLVEMKWLNEPVGVGDVSNHLVRVYSSSESRGICISYSGYTAPAIEKCKESLSNIVVILCTLEEFVLLVEKEGSVEQFLKEKIRGSIIDKKPFTKILT